VEDESPDGGAVEGGLGGEVARGAGAEGSSVQDDLMGGDFADLGEVVEGCFDVAVDHVFAGSFVVASGGVISRGVAIVGVVAMGWSGNAQAVARVIVRHNVHAQHQGQVLHAVVHHAQILGVAMTEEEGLRGIASSDEEGGYFVYLPIANVVGVGRRNITRGWIAILRTVVDEITINVVCWIGRSVLSIQTGQIALLRIQTHDTRTVAMISIAAVIALAGVAVPFVCA